MSLSDAQVYGLARSAGLNHERAVLATAVARGESGLNPAAVGDTSLTTDTWGPSVGLWQVRSLNADEGTGRARDRTRLMDPAFNARAMFQISKGGRDWSPWTIYTNGAYRAHLAGVREAVGDQAGADFEPIFGPIIPPGINPLHPDAPGPGPDELVGPGGEWRALVVTGVLVAGGIALVLVGAGVVSKPLRDKIPGGGL